MPGVGMLVAALESTGGRLTRAEEGDGANMASVGQVL